MYLPHPKALFFFSAIDNSKWRNFPIIGSITGPNFKLKSARDQSTKTAHQEKKGAKKGEVPLLKIKAEL